MYVYKHFFTTFTDGLYGYDGGFTPSHLWFLIYLIAIALISFPVITGNCIYAVNHSCKWDSQYLMEMLPKRFSFLAGKQRLKIVDRMGVYRNCQKTNTPIIPLCLEYVEDKCVIKYADVLTSRAGEDKLLQIENLRDNMATLKWEIREMFPAIKRAELADDYWDKEVAKRLSEYKLLDYEYEMSCVRKE